jgi:hypothetical protein
MEKLLNYIYFKRMADSRIAFILSQLNKSKIQKYEERNFSKENNFHQFLHIQTIVTYSNTYGTANFWLRLLSKCAEIIWKIPKIH